jgi:hypothetical protein
VTLVVGVLVAAIVLPAMVPIVAPLGFGLGLVVVGVIAWAIFVLAVATIAILPPFLLSARDRAVFATHSWIGAREVRRVFGRAAAAAGVPTHPASAAAWLASTPATDINRMVRVDALVLAGRFDDARAEAELLPERTPLEAYRKLEEMALVADQTGGPIDEGALRAALAAIPPGVDRTEAAVSLAVFHARRSLPDGDWRAPLLEVRPMIPGSDARILIVHFGLPVLEITARKVVIPFTVLLVLIAASLIVLPATPR